MDTFQVALIIGGLIFITGIYGLIKKVYFSIFVTSIIKKTFIIFSIILIIASILSYFDTYFRGYWTTKLLIWFFIFAASLLFAFGNRLLLTKILKIVTSVIFYFPLVSAIFFFVVPFLGPVLTISIWGHILGSTNDVFYSDNEIRIQRVFKGALGPAGPPTLFEKKGIIEIDKGNMNLDFYENPDSLKVDKTKDTTTVYFYYNGEDDLNPIIVKFGR